MLPIFFVFKLYSKYVKSTILKSKKMEQTTVYSKKFFLIYNLLIIILEIKSATKMLITNLRKTLDL